MMIKSSKEKVKREIGSEKSILLKQIESIEKQQKILRKELEEHKKELFKS